MPSHIQPIVSYIRFLFAIWFHIYWLLPTTKENLDAASLRQIDHLIEILSQTSTANIDLPASQVNHCALNCQYYVVMNVLPSLLRVHVISGIRQRSFSIRVLLTPRLTRWRVDAA